MPHDPILHLLGLAKRPDGWRSGEEPVGRGRPATRPGVLLLAADAAPNTVRRAAHFGEAGATCLAPKLPFTKAELGEQLGRSSCAMLAVTDFGLRRRPGGEAGRRDPEHYGPAAQQLEGRPTAPSARRKAPAQKNLREGKRKPWAPPAPKEGRSRPPSRRGSGAKIRRPGQLRPASSPPHRPANVPEQTRAGPGQKTGGGSGP